MIRLIAIDMDGTLLNPELVVSKRNKQAILDAQANGIEVVIATGRGFPEADGPVTQAQLDIPYICLNGAEVRDSTGKVIASTSITGKYVPQIIAILEHEKIDHQVFIGDHVYTKNAEEFVDLYIQIMKSADQVPPVESIRREINQKVEEGYIRVVDTFDHLIKPHGTQVYKVFGSTLNHDSLDRAKASLTKLPGIAVSSSGASNIEITDINAQKGIALEKYANSRGISMEHVMVIGDSYNDVSMMKRAGLPVAMGNATEEIKANCTKITETNKNDGVALAIEDVLSR